jgi:hypothetical protein
LRRCISSERCPAARRMPRHARAGLAGAPLSKSARYRLVLARSAGERSRLRGRRRYRARLDWGCLARRSLRRRGCSSLCCWGSLGPQLSSGRSHRGKGACCDEAGGSAEHKSSWLCAEQLTARRHACEGRTWVISRMPRGAQETGAGSFCGVGAAGLGQRAGKSLSGRASASGCSL